jgi:anti-anti-sigma factor
MEEHVDLKEEMKGNVTIVRIKGRLDAISTTSTEKRVFDMINHGQNKLLFDFTQVDYLSSAGMRMLLSTQKKLKTLSGKLVVCSVSTNVMDVLKMSGFDNVLDLSKTEEDGLQKFS